MDQKARIDARIVSIDGKLDLLLSEIKGVGRVLEDVKNEASLAKLAAVFSFNLRRKPHLGN